MKGIIWVSLFCYSVSNVGSASRRGRQQLLGTRVCPEGYSVVVLRVVYAWEGGSHENSEDNGDRLKVREQARRWAGAGERGEEEKIR